MELSGRVKSLDGLRAIAALGVLWIHIWTMFNNPRLLIGKIDLASVLALGGNGVDLFFVISGFCMYYFYAKKPTFILADFSSFLKKRFKRLSPAFYAISVIYIIWYSYHHQLNDVFMSLINTLTFSVFTNDFVAPHFWTLSVEWQFYIIVPFILYFQSKIGFKKIFYFFLIFMLALSVMITLYLKEASNPYTYQITFRYVEFAAGVYVAHLILNNKHIKHYRLIYLFFFIIVTYSGRIFISSPILKLLPHYYNIFKIIGFSLMGIGFAGILILTLSSKYWLNKLLANRLMSLIGKISYSFYLLHALVQYVIGGWLIKLLGSINIPVFFKVVLVFFACTMVLIPLSMLSFRFFETPYKKKLLRF